MAEVNKSALVSYSAEQMFDLVDDVARYPDFLPWCASTQVIKRQPEQLEARIDLALVGLKHSFTTRNHNQRPDWIKIQLVKGPFSHLQGQWTFQALGDIGCKIQLDMQFSFSNPLLKRALEPMFTKITNSLLDAFVQRAKVVYV